MFLEILPARTLVHRRRKKFFQKLMSCYGKIVLVLIITCLARSNFFNLVSCLKSVEVLKNQHSPISTSTTTSNNFQTTRRPLDLLVESASNQVQSYVRVKNGLPFKVKQSMGKWATSGPQSKKAMVNSKFAYDSILSIKKAQRENDRRLHRDKFKNLPSTLVNSLRGTLPPANQATNSPSIARQPAEVAIRFDDDDDEGEIKTQSNLQDNTNDGGQDQTSDGPNESTIITENLLLILNKVENSTKLSDEQASDTNKSLNRSSVRFEEPLRNQNRESNKWLMVEPSSTERVPEAGSERKAALAATQRVATTSSMDAKYLPQVHATLFSQSDDRATETTKMFRKSSDFSPSMEEQEASTKPYNWLSSPSERFVESTSLTNSPLPTTGSFYNELKPTSTRAQQSTRTDGPRLESTSELPLLKRQEPVDSASDVKIQSELVFIDNSTSPLSSRTLSSFAPSNNQLLELQQQRIDKRHLHLNLNGNSQAAGAEAAWPASQRQTAASGGSYVKDGDLVSWPFPAAASITRKRFDLPVAAVFKSAQSASSANIRVTADNSTKPLLINSRGLITAAKRGNSPHNNSAVNSTHTTYLAFLDSKPTGDFRLSLKKGNPNQPPISDELPTFLKRPLVVTDTLWGQNFTPALNNRTNHSPSSGNIKIFALNDLVKFDSHVGNSTLATTLLEPLIGASPTGDQDAGANKSFASSMFQHNPPYKQTLLELPQASSSPFDQQTTSLNSLRISQQQQTNEIKRTTQPMSGGPNPTRRPATGQALLVRNQPASKNKQHNAGNQKNQYPNQIYENSSLAQASSLVDDAAGGNSPSSRPAGSAPVSGEHLGGDPIIQTNHVGISQQLNTYQPTGTNKTANRIRTKLQNMLGRNKLNHRWSNVSSSYTTTQAPSSVSIANNVASLLAQKLNFLSIAPKPASYPNYHYNNNQQQPSGGLNSLFSFRVSSKDRLKQRVNQMASGQSTHSNINRRTAGMGSLLFSGFIYGLSVLPALMALTGINPLSEITSAASGQAANSVASKKSSSSGKKSLPVRSLIAHTAAPSSSAYAFLVPLVAAASEALEGSEELASPAHDYEAAESILKVGQPNLKGLYQPAPTILEPSAIESDLHPLIEELSDAQLDENPRPGRYHRETAGPASFEQLWRALQLQPAADHSRRSIAAADERKLGADSLAPKLAARQRQAAIANQGQWASPSDQSFADNLPPIGSENHFKHSPLLLTAGDQQSHSNSIQSSPLSGRFVEPSSDAKAKDGRQQADEEGERRGDATAGGFRPMKRATRGPASAQALLNSMPNPLRDHNRLATDSIGANFGKQSDNNKATGSFSPSANATGHPLDADWPLAARRYSNLISRLRQPVAQDSATRTLASLPAQEQLKQALLAGAKGWQAKRAREASILAAIEDETMLLGNYVGLGGNEPIGANSMIQRQRRTTQPANTFNGPTLMRAADGGRPSVNIQKLPAKAAQPIALDERPAGNRQAGNFFPRESQAQIDDRHSNDRRNIFSHNWPIKSYQATNLNGPNNQSNPIALIGAWPSQNRSPAPNEDSLVKPANGSGDFFQMPRLKSEQIERKLIKARSTNKKRKRSRGKTKPSATTTTTTSASSTKAPKTLKSIELDSGESAVLLSHAMAMGNGILNEPLTIFKH